MERKYALKIRTRDIVISGLFGGITILLGATRWGFIPIPTPVGDATLMHIPVILGAVIEGPVVGLFLSLLFGLFSWMWGILQNPFFADPLVAILPRIFIGPIAFLTYFLVNKALGKRREKLSFISSSIGAIFGTATNTSLVLTALVLRVYIPVELAYFTAATSGVTEAVLAVLITIPVVYAVNAYRNRRR